MLSALKQMDEIDKKLLLVFEDDKFVNVVSVGDIQRAIINKKELETPIKNILRKKTLLAREEDSFDDIKSKMLEFRTEFMPVIDSNNLLKQVYFWEDVFGEKQRKPKVSLDLPVVIMAGGIGSRLQPITNVIPKPLLPIGDKTIIEEIMDRFVNVGCRDFYLSVNYKAETLKHYFSQKENSTYNIDYIQESKPLGTAGSLYLLKSKINKTFFISNCDIIIDEDYQEVLNYHVEKKNELTIVSALKHYSIPYGTIETTTNGQLIDIKEKPEFTLQINSGMYILEPHLLNEIPDNEFFHITHLFDKILQRKGRIGVFPVSEKSWIEIGRAHV